MIVVVSERSKPCGSEVDRMIRNSRQSQSPVLVVVVRDVNDCLFIIMGGIERVYYSAWSVESEYFVPLGRMWLVHVL